MPPGERHARGAGTGEGAAVPAVATRGRCADSPSTLIFTWGPMVNWGRVGTGFSPECDAVGWGGGGREEGRVRARIPSPCYSWGASPPRLCPPPPPPGSQGSPKAGEPRIGVAAGSRLYSLEAQQTNTFILRHFQCRLWVGVAGEETGPESLFLQMFYPVPSSIRNSPHSLQTAPLAQCPSVPPPPFGHWSWWLCR